MLRRPLFTLALFLAAAPFAPCFGDVPIPMPYHDGYAVQEEIARFPELHQRFAIIRQNDRLLVISRSLRQALSVLKDLESWAVASGDRPAKPSPKPLAFPAIPGAVSIDVTDSVPSEAKLLTGTYTESGPNCWNLALFTAGLTHGIFTVDEQEMAFWTQSPLARELSPEEPRRPGDMIVMRTNRGEWHSAIWVSPDVVFTKNGASRDKPFRLMDRTEMNGIYLSPRTPVHVSAYRFAPLMPYLESHWHQYPPELRDAWTEISAVEKASLQYALSVSQPESSLDNALFDVRQEFKQLRRNIGNRLLRQTNARASAQELDSDLRWSWRMIRARATSFAKH